MSNAKTSISRRFLAALLSFVLVLGLLPTSTLTAFAATAEHPDAITVSVTDQDGKALAGVTVAYSLAPQQTEMIMHPEPLQPMQMAASRFWQKISMLLTILPYLQLLL